MTIHAVQIDTHNRNYSINDEVGLQPSFLPQMVKTISRSNDMSFKNIFPQVSNNMTNLKSGLSPLIECPCRCQIICELNFSNLSQRPDKKDDRAFLIHPHHWKVLHTHTHIYTHTYTYTYIYTIVTSLTSSQPAALQ